VAEETRQRAGRSTPHAVITDQRHQVADDDSCGRGLGRRALVPEDPDTAAAVLAGMHGGPRRAAAWLRHVLDRLEVGRA
jgi:hypothetical protein